MLVEVCLLISLVLLWVTLCVYRTRIGFVCDHCGVYLGKKNKCPGCHQWGTGTTDVSPMTAKDVYVRYTLPRIREICKAAQSRKGK